MAYALISPNEKVYRIANYESVVDSDGNHIEYQAVKEEISGGQLITEIQDTQFEVASPLHWLEVNASVTCLDYYYDPADSTVKTINHATVPTDPPA